MLSGREPELQGAVCFGPLGPDPFKEEEKNHELEPTKKNRIRSQKNHTAPKIL